MLGFSNDAWVALGALGGLVGTTVPPVMGWLMRSAKAAHRAEMLTQASEYTGKLDMAKAECTAQVSTLGKDLAVSLKQAEVVNASIKAAWAIIDDLRFNAVRKQDQDKLRDEFRSDIDKLGTRLEMAIKALSDDIHRNNKGD